ncbi:hypothetical protein GMDG_00326 [Pseudogymnoascus destructans 20631-21]|uniref:N-acetyltransferase domain-containing protein n=2 Tax=Pseudogymnoascus destructans TaxID=655981 RepID=L8G1N2_PSED2|nr:hypothetical protein GMDG_00326 [Pseudogymnoascus destructans 20631-21]
MRRQRIDHNVSEALPPKPDFSPGSYGSNVGTLAKENTNTVTDTTEPVAQSTRTDSTGSIEPQTPVITNVLTPHPQTGTKLVIATPQVDSEVKLAETPRHKLPPHLRRGNIIQTPKSSADNRQIFKKSPISPPIPPSVNANASLSSSDQMPVQQQKGLPSSMGETTSPGEPKWQGNVVSSSNSPLLAVGFRATSNRLASPIAITSSNPSSAGSPIHIFPFHLRETQVPSSLVNSKVTIKEDCTEIYDNPGLHSRNESVASRAGFAPIKLPPHLRREPSIPVESTEILAEQKGPTPVNANTAASQENGSQQSIKEAKPHYIPPHLRGKKSNTQQSSVLNKSTAASIPNESTSGHSSNTIGGVPLVDNRKASIAAKTELEAVITQPPQPSSGSAQLNVCQGEEYNTGFFLHTDGGLVKDVAPRVYSDASIKTHSAQKDGSDALSEWADLRKPGPVKSLCISDDDFKDDASVKKFIGAALAECPGDVIRLNSLNDNYFYTADPTGQEWHLDVTEEFLNAFVKVWQENLPEEVIVVNIKAMEFMGSFPINVNSFMDALEHPESFPNPSTDNKEKQKEWTSNTAMERRQTRKLAIARRRQRGKNTYFVPNMQLGVQPFDWGEAAVPEKPYIAIHVRPAEMKDVPGITAIYNQWVLNSFIPEDQQPVTEENIKAVFEATRKCSYPFIVAIRGDPPVGSRVAKSNEVVGFAMVERCLGFGGTFNGRSRSTAMIQFYVHRECLRHGIGGHLLDQLLRRVSRLHVPFSDRNIWINPTRDAAYEQIPNRFHQIVVNRPVDKPNDPEFMWFDAFMKKYKIWERHRTLSVARKPPTTSGPGATFLDIVTYQHEAELDVRVEG